MLLAPGPAGAADATCAADCVAPRIDVNSWMQPGRNGPVEEAIASLGLGGVRDGLVWARIETSPGVHDFSVPAALGIGDLAARGLIGSLTLYPDNPIYEGGNTVVTDAGIAAFVDYAAAVAEAFPTVPRLEIGNEFNSQVFVRGPARDMTPLERARLHARYLAALRADARLAGREILGGASHSLAAGYIWTELDQGRHLMDAVAIHPYTTAPEMIARELEVLRRHPAMTGVKVEMTEFGTPRPAEAPDHFWRSYCGMALGGVSRAVWYPLEPRGDGFAPVIDGTQKPTPVGRAILLARREIAGRPVRPLAFDDFVHGCLFDNRIAVIWGAPRALEPARAGLDILGADLQPLGQPGMLSAEAVRIVVSREGLLDPERDLRLSPTDLVADSLDQFAFPVQGEPALGAGGRGFSRSIRLGGDERQLETCPGQQAPRTTWHPYLCTKEVPDFALTPESFALGGSREHPVELVFRYRSETDTVLRLEAVLDIVPASKDGVGVSVLAPGAAPQRQVAKAQARLVFAPVAVRGGDAIEVVIDPNGGPAYDVGKLRLQLHDEAVR